MESMKGLRRWWWLLGIALVLGAGVGLAIHDRIASAETTSRSEVLVTGLFTDEEVDDAFTSNQYVNQRMSTYAEIASSELVAAAAAETLGVEPSALSDTVIATVAGSTTVLGIEVQGDDPANAQERTTAVTNALIATITELETPASGPPRVRLSVITEPTAPAASSIPPPAAMVGGGAAAGLLAALLVLSAMRLLAPGPLSEQAYAAPTPDGPTTPDSPTPDGPDEQEQRAPPQRLAPMATPAPLPVRQPRTRLTSWPDTAPGARNRARSPADRDESVARSDAAGSDQLTSEEQTSSRWTYP